MKALTVRQPYASLIAQGEKTIEVRSRQISHRGELVIHSATSPDPWHREWVKEENFPLGSVLCIVNLVDCRLLKSTDIEAAWLPDDYDVSDQYAWVLENICDIEPVPFKGQLNLWNFPDELIKRLG